MYVEDLEGAPSFAPYLASNAGLPYLGLEVSRVKYLGSYWAAAPVGHDAFSIRFSNSRHAAS